MGLEDILKKTRIISIAVTVILAVSMIVNFAGCSNDALATLDTGTTLQDQIDTAAAGSSVTLDPARPGDSITISKALTVNGSGIENLSITVAANNVTLTNFTNASISYTNGASGNPAHSVISSRSVSVARHADGGETVSPKELGDDNPKFYLENCTVDRLTAYEDVTIFLGRDNEKVEIEELELKDGIEDFVLIGKDEEDDADDAKSRIEKISVEAGIEEVNLVGGRLEDIEFKGVFDEKVDFYYEEKTNQATNEFKQKLEAAAAQAEAMDVCAVRNGSGVYMITVPKEKIAAAQRLLPADAGWGGSIFIMLMTDAQRDAYLATIPENPSTDYPGNLYVEPVDGNDVHVGWPWATKNQPYFEVRYTGSYLFDLDDDAPHAVSGDRNHFYYEIDGEPHEEFFNYYQSYSADAICSQCSGDDFTIYLDMSNLRKSDLNTCAFKAEDGTTDEYYCTPNKLTEIDLTGYKPYIAFDFMYYHDMLNPMGGDLNVPQERADAEVYFGQEFGRALNEIQISVPISKLNQGGGAYVFMFEMDEADSYPAGASWEQIPVPQPQGY